MRFGGRTYVRVALRTTTSTATTIVVADNKFYTDRNRRSISEFQTCYYDIHNVLCLCVILLCIYIYLGVCIQQCCIYIILVYIVRHICLGIQRVSNAIL